MTKRELLRGAAYIAAVVLPWAALVAVAVAAVQCAQADEMPLGEAVAPPKAAICWALGMRQPDHAYPDCTDYARAALAGIAHGRAAVAYTETGEAHTVATFDANGDTWVIDNRYPGRARYWRNLPYRWVSRQDGELYRGIIQ